MAEKSIIISAEEEAILLKPIDEYVGKIQEQIDALRVEGSDKVNSLKNQIAIAKENKNLTKEEQNKIIGECKKNLEKAKATEDANKQQIAKLIADAEGFLSKHYNSEYYNIVAKSCEAEKKAENSNFEKLKADLQEEHKKAVSRLKDAEEIKAEKYTYKNKLYDAQMTHESRIQEIKDRKHPLVADIHFDYRLAIAAIENGADKIRINPGNIGDEKRVRAVVEKAKEYNIPIRVGVNSGSLEKHLVEKYHGVTAEGLVESALDKVHMIEEMGYDNLVVSIKSSDVMMCVKAHELLAPVCPYPLHVGITESGTLLAGNIKSSIGLGLILSQGIGDTIRVSLTGDPVEEIKSAKLILKTLGLRKGGIEVVSCPTCGRTKIDLIGLANKVEEMVADIPLDIKVAVMGCVVNGPGEAKEADIGIAGGIGEGLLIKKGEVVKKVKEDELLETLRQELLHWNE